MNTINPDENSRPFGFWLKAVDRLMAAEFASAFEAEGVTRREWRLLNVIDDTATGDRRKSDRLRVHKLSRLIGLDWVTDTEGTWILTDSGRAAKERLGSVAESIRAKVTDAVPADDLATTMATLEQIARAFGWDESTPLPRRGFSRRTHGFGHPAHRARRFGHERHDEADFGGQDDCQHARPHGREGHLGHRGGHPRARFAHFAQGAYERGFDAGFTRGRSDR